MNWFNKFRLRTKSKGSIVISNDQLTYCPILTVTLGTMNFEAMIFGKGACDVAFRNGIDLSKQQMPASWHIGRPQYIRDRRVQRNARVELNVEF